MINMFTIEKKKNQKYDKQQLSYSAKNRNKFLRNYLKTNLQYFEVLAWLDTMETVWEDCRTGKTYWIAEP